MKQKAELQFLKGDHVPGDIVSGILMIGNPFVRIKPFSIHSGNEDDLR
jgi:hypothetical protein